LGNQLLLPHTLSFLGPIAITGVRLQLSRKHRLVTCHVRKRKHALSSLLTASSWIDDHEAWLSVASISRGFMIIISGMQMDELEKLISRSETLSECPPLVDLKDTFTFFFQRSEHPYVCRPISGTRGPDIGALVLQHGFRRDHRTGYPAADISICFLERSFIWEVVP